MIIGGRNTGSSMRRIGSGLACMAALSLTAMPASAQEDGAIVDPDSPSGKEYEIPLESARRQADPRPASPKSISSGTSRPTLFGEGVITPSSARAARKQDGSSGADEGSDGHGARSGTDRRPEAVKIAASQPGAPDSGLGTPALFLGIGLAVLLVGAGAGFVIRRRSG